MKTDIIKEKCEILEKTIIELSKLYALQETTLRQKALLETMVGASIWYLSCPEELYTGMISEKAEKAIREGMPIGKLTKEHLFPRKQAGKILLTEKYKEFSNKKLRLFDLFISDLGKFNRVLKNENSDLIEFQKDDTFITAEKSYIDAKINLVKMTMGELKSISPLELEKKAKKAEKIKQKQIKNLGTGPKAAVNRVGIRGRVNFENSIKPVKETKPSIIRQQVNEDEGSTDKIVGISINNSRLQIPGRLNMTNCFTTFMNYCIVNHANEIQSNNRLQKRFKNDPQDSSFGKAIHYKRILGQSGLFYSTYIDSKTKFNYMNEIASELGLQLEFYYQSFPTFTI